MWSLGHWAKAMWSLSNMINWTKSEQAYVLMQMSQELLYRAPTTCMKGSKATSITKLEKYKLYAKDILYSGVSMYPWNENLEQSILRHVLAPAIHTWVTD